MRFPACCRCRFWRGWRRRRCRCRCRGSRCGWFRHLLLHTNKALIPPRPMRLEEPGTQKNTFDSTNSSKRAVDAVEDWPPHSDADLLLPSMEDEGWNIQKCNLYHRVEPAAAWTWTKTFTCSQNLTDSPQRWEDWKNAHWLVARLFLGTSLADLVKHGTKGRRRARSAVPPRSLASSRVARRHPPKKLNTVQSMYPTLYWYY